MPRRSSTQPDAQMLTERAHRQSGSRVGDSGLNTNRPLLSGTSIPDQEAVDEARRRRRAARYPIRHGHDDNDRDELLNILGLTYEEAAPLPADQVARPKAAA